MNHMKIYMGQIFDLHLCTTTSVSIKLVNIFFSQHDQDKTTLLNVEPIYDFLGFQEHLKVSLFRVKAH